MGGFANLANLNGIQGTLARRTPGFGAFNPQQSALQNPLQTPPPVENPIARPIFNSPLQGAAPPVVSNPVSYPTPVAQGPGGAAAGGMAPWGGSPPMQNFNPQNFNPQQMQNLMQQRNPWGYGAGQMMPLSRLMGY